MRRSLPHLTACLLAVVLFGCQDETGGCTKKVNVGAASSTVTVTHDGQSYSVTSDANGDVDVPCDADTTGVAAEIPSV